MHSVFNKAFLAALTVAVTMGLQPQAHAAGPTQVMLLEGESGGPYHAWQLTTPVLKKELEETGLFQVDVVTAPPAGGDFSAFHPEFGKYQVIVMNYDAPDDRWNDALRTAFESYVRGGGGLVVVHAADNAFPHWEAFNQMIGIGGCRGRSGSFKKENSRRIRSLAGLETMVIAYPLQSLCKMQIIPSRKVCRTSGCIRAMNSITVCADPART